MKIALVVLLSCSRPTPPPKPVPKPPIDAAVPSVDVAIPVDAAQVVIDAAIDASIINAPVDAMPVTLSGPRIYINAHRARLKGTLDANASAAARYRAVVDRWLAKPADVWGFQPWHAALLSQLGGDPRYCVAAVANVEAQVVAAEKAIAGGSVPLVAGDSYLDVGDLIGGLAVVYDWCPQVTEAQKTRWVIYANQAVNNVWSPNTARWGTKPAPWTGWSINNPSNNYYYSFLRATMLLGLATQNAALLDLFRSKMATLAATFDRDLQGGGSREGTGYGVAMRRLFEIYTWWHASTGEQLADRTSHTLASLAAMVHQIMPTLDKIAPIGDQSRDSTAALFDYHRAYLLELIGLYPTHFVAGFAKDLLARSSVPQMQSGFMAVYDFLHDGEGSVGAVTPPLLYHAVGASGIYARSSWSRDATWIGVQAGPYTESHAHQDQGSILIYNKEWLAFDAVIVSKSGLPQATTAHSMVRAEGVRQVASTTSPPSIVRAGPGWNWISADSTPAYGRSPAITVTLARRDVVFLHPGVIVVFDRFASTTASTWQLVVPVAPMISGAVATVGRLTAHRVSAGPAWTSRDLKGENADYTGGFRLELPGHAGDFNDEDLYDFDTESYVRGRLVLECPCCGGEHRPLLSPYTEPLRGGMRWVGCDHREPYTDYVARCAKTKGLYLFTTYTPQ